MSYENHDEGNIPNDIFKSFIGVVLMAMLSLPAVLALLCIGLIGWAWHTEGEW
jgi:hypothetical protein